MAKAEFQLPTNLMSLLTELGRRQDEICAKCVESGAEVLERQVRRNLAARIGEGTKFESRSTGNLLHSLGTTPAKVDRGGRTNAKVGFSEPRRDGGDPNGKIAAILEYGKHGQPAKPFMKPALRTLRSEIESTMIHEFERQVAQL